MHWGRKTTWTYTFLISIRSWGRTTQMWPNSWTTWPCCVRIRANMRRWNITTVVPWRSTSPGWAQMIQMWPKPRTTWWARSWQEIHSHGPFSRLSFKPFTSNAVLVDKNCSLLSCECNEVNAGRVFFGCQQTRSFVLSALVSAEVLSLYIGASLQRFHLKCLLNSTVFLFVFFPSLFLSKGHDLLQHKIFIKVSNQFTLAA